MKLEPNTVYVYSRNRIGGWRRTRTHLFATWVDGSVDYSLCGTAYILLEDKTVTIEKDKGLFGLRDDDCKNCLRSLRSRTDVA